MRSDVAKLSHIWQIYFNDILIAHISPLSLRSFLAIIRPHGKFKIESMWHSQKWTNQNYHKLLMMQLDTFICESSKPHWSDHSHYFNGAIYLSIFKCLVGWKLFIIIASISLFHDQSLIQDHLCCLSCLLPTLSREPG